MKKIFFVICLLCASGYTVVIGVAPQVEWLSAGNEIISLRDASAKTYAMPDGKRCAVISTGSIHYKNELRSWEDIDLAITKSNNPYFPYENKTNNMKSVFPKTAFSEGIVLISEKGSIKIFGKPEILHIDEDGSVSTIEIGSDAIAEVSENTISYKLFKNALAEFIVLPDELKFDLILNSLDESLKNRNGFLGFSEIISLPVGWSIADEKGNIQTKKICSSGLKVIDENGEPVFIFPEPSVYEKENPSRRLGSRKNRDSERAFYVVERLDERFRLTVHVPLKWLKEAERNFPVVIDPTVTLYADFIYSTGFIEYISPSTYSYHSNYGSYNAETYVGSLNMPEIGWYACERGWEEFNTSSIPTSATVSSVVLYFNCRTYSVIGGPAFYMNLYKMSVRPSTSGASAIFSNIGALSAYATSIYVSYNGWYNRTLGSTANTDVNSGSGWFAVGFREVNESGATWDEAAFYGNLSGGNRPYLVVTYTAGCVVGTWLGTTSTDWNTASNWCESTIPTSTTDVIIPDGATTTYDPTISSTAVCRNMTIQSGGIINGGTGTLTIHGNWSNAGTFNRGTSTITFAGASDQTISGTSASNFHNLHNNKTGGKLILGQNIGVANKLNMLYPGTHTIRTGTYKIDFTP